jgi:hypothetical protein
MNAKEHDIFLQNCVDFILIKISNKVKQNLNKYNLNLATLHDDEITLDFIKMEFSNIKKLLQQSNTDNLDILNQYKNLSEKGTPENDDSKRKILIVFMHEITFQILLKNDSKFLHNIIDNHGYKEIYQLNKYKNFIEIASLLEYSQFLKNEVDRINRSKQQKLQWHGNKIELVELIKSLIEADIIKGDQSDITKIFENFFGFSLNNFDQSLQKAAGRNNGNETLFLDKLKQNFYNFSTKTAQEKRDANKERKKTSS